MCSEEDFVGSGAQVIEPGDQDEFGQDHSEIGLNNRISKAKSFQAKKGPGLIKGN